MNADYDVIVIGGAFAGASTALMLKRQRPQTRILIIERATVFDRKVGESTSEVGACFMTRFLRITHHLDRYHLPKQGLRMWFNDDQNECPTMCSEVGSYYQSRLPTYQLDRAVLDAHLLDLAVKAGCELRRPAKVTEWVQETPQKNVLTYEHESVTHTATSRWIVDASGKVAMIARKLGHWRRLESHPTNAVWARFEGVADLDSYQLAEKYPAWANATRCGRNPATNHLTGRGWWCWIIPLKDGAVSLGLTYDRRLFSLPEGADLGARLKAHVMQHPIGKLMFEHATPIAGDTRAYGHLPYYSEKIADDGWSCVGDAAGFMDPLYSQGLDYAGHTVCASLRLITKALDGMDVTGDAAKLSADFNESYMRWQESLYLNKYHYLGDAELMRVAFLLDLGFYFVGPVRLVHDFLDEEMSLLPYAGKVGGVVAKIMSLYNRRLSHIAERRWAAGQYGRKNTGMRWLLKRGFAPDATIRRTIYDGLKAWLMVELHALTLPRLTEPVAKPAPVPA